jgi:2,5-dihydroxypyridine 5,6-dioxygenase
MVMMKLAVSYAASTQHMPYFVKSLQHCAVKESETVLIHTDTESYPHYPAAFLGAARILSADSYILVHPVDTPEKGAIKAWQAADLVIDLSSEQHAYADIAREAINANTRILRVGQPWDVMKRLFPTEALKQRVMAGGAIMEKGATLRITSPGGTDLKIRKGKRYTMKIWGGSDIPGRWDIWPSGMVCTAPEEDSAEGTLVVDKGDVLLSMAHYVEDPITMKVKDGLITELSGKGKDTSLLKEWLGKTGHPDAYRISHVGWGCNDKAQWDRLAMSPRFGFATQDNEAFYGNMQIAFGSNYGIFPDGRTKCPSHIDFPSRRNSFWVDDVQVMNEGKFVRPELQ